MTRFRTALFDLDGTLLDHFAAIHRNHSQTLQSFGLAAPSFEEVHRSVGGGLETSIAKLLGPAHADLVPEATQRYWQNWPNNLLYQAKLMPGTLELLKKLKSRDITCAVFTNKFGPSARAVLDHLGATPYLAGVFGAKDTPYLKPDIEFSQHVLTALHAQRETTCLIGDSPFDIETGKVAGFPVYCVTTGTHSAAELQAAKADGVYPDLDTLGKAVFGV